MRLIEIFTTCLATASVASSLSIRSTRYGRGAVSRREAEPEPEVLHAPSSERFDDQLLSYLEKRRGGGGSGGGGGRGGSSGGSSSSGSSGSSGGGSSSGGRSGSSGSTGGSRNTGSASSSSISRPSYGGGKYYGGGSVSPYRAGGRSPAGLLPFALAGSALFIFPGLWLYGAYAYDYNHPYGFRNRTSNRNESLPVKCLCEMYSACGCDDPNNSTYLDEIVGNGSAADQNSTLVHVGNVNGTKTLIINGTLPNGTDSDNTTQNDSAEGSSPSPTSAASRKYLLESSGFWLMGAIVGATVWWL